MQSRSSLIARAQVWNGSAWVNAPGDATNGLDVDVTRLPALPAGGNAIGSVSVSNLPATQSVSGTVAVSNPTTSPETGLAKDATLTARLPAALDADGGLKVHQQTAVALDATTLAALETIQVGSLPAVTLDAATLAALETISVANFPASQAVTGTFWQTTQPVSAASLPLPSGAAQEHATAASPHSARLTDGTTYIGSTAQRLHVDDGGSSLTVDGTVGLAAGTNNIGDVDVLSLPALPAGANQIGTTLGPTLTKSTQGATGYSTQDLKDAGRNQSNLFMVLPILTTAAEVMMSLTGYKSGAAVTATATPAVVTAGKTLRITAIIMTYVATATAGQAKFTFRVNTGGVAVIGSPLAAAHVVGAGTPATAGSSQTEALPMPDGWELPAGAGIAVGLQGLSAAMAGAVAGYGKCSIYGYEY